MDRATYRASTALTFVSLGVVSASLAAAQQARPGGTLPDGIVAYGQDAAADRWQCGDPAGTSSCGVLGGGDAAGVEDASPLSTQTLLQHSGGSLTPTSVDSCNGVTAAYKLQVQQQQQASAAAVQKQQQLLVLQQQQQLPAAPQQQQYVLLLQATQQPRQQQPTAHASVVARRTLHWPAGRQARGVQQRQQQLLVPQTSNTSSSSSSTGGTMCSSLAAAYGSSNSQDGSTLPLAATMTGGATITANRVSNAWQRLIQYQQQQLQQQQQQCQPQLVAGSIGIKRSSSQLQWGQLPPTQQQLQPAAKRAATTTSVAALLQASQCGVPRQQLLLLQRQQPQQVVLAADAGMLAPPQFARMAGLPPTGLSLKHRQQQQQQQQQQQEAAHVMAAAAAAAPVCGLEPMQSKLLAWAGSVLSCQLQDAYLLASHMFKSVSGRLDDMMLISLGVTAPSASVTMLISLWVATKLEGHRRQVAGASKLAAALQLMPGVVVDVEVHLMQLLNWQPYAGWAAPAGAGIEPAGACCFA